MGMLNEAISIEGKINRKIEGLSYDQAHTLYVRVCAVREELKNVGIDIDYFDY